MIGYNLDENGNIVLIGLWSQAVFNFELTDEPFTIYNYQDYRKDLITNEWIFDPIIMIPQTISKLQAVSRLLEIERYNDLMTALDSDETGVKRILFDAAHELDRDSDMVNEIGVVLGFDNEGVDNFFLEASKILV